MRLKDILDIVNEPIIVINNENIGYLKDLRTQDIKKYLNYNICFIEGLQKSVVLYLERKEKKK